MSIFIFSRPINSGKTTDLLAWCKQKKNVSGILMPDIDGRRKILDISTMGFFDIECLGPHCANEPIISIGRFNFFISAFEKANTIIFNALNAKSSWILIDEVGKLELEEKGFYKSVKYAVELFNHINHPGNLILTVRESLINDVMLFFNIPQYKLVHSTGDIF